MFTALTFLFLFYQQPELPPDAEKLPEVPKLSDKSVMKALNPEKTLFLETAPDKDGKMKPVRILFAAEVCLSKGPLEVFCTKRGTKEHESILRINFDAKYLHAGLLAIGAKPGKPVQWVDPKTEKPDYKPASGEFIDVSVNYTLKGKSFNHPAQEWILDSKTSKVMKHEWVFAGSRFYKNPERPADPDYYMANNGEVISISNFADSMLDLPVEVTSSNDDLFFQCNDKKIPPLLSKVWVIMTPKPKK
ncbi:MAG: YdjY domain-containing protein [Gemmataceae bacterium]